MRLKLGSLESVLRFPMSLLCLISKILLENSNVRIQQAILAAVLNSMLRTSGLVVSASLSVACLGLYLVAVVTCMCQQ